MANEFIARNGITSLGNIVVSGSITSTGAITISGSIASSSFAATASSADNFLARGTLTAQTIVVQTITSSIDWVTGSAKFGSINSNAHQFTGSVSISGSSTFGLNVNAGALYVSSSGQVGIGTLAPNNNLHIHGSGAGLNLSGGNNRIYFNSTRAIEGDGTQMQIGEGHAKTFLQTSTGGSVVTVTGSIVSIGSTTPDLGAALSVNKTGAGLQDTVYLTNLQSAAADTGVNLWFLGGPNLNSLGRIAAGWTGATTTTSYMSFYTRGDGSTTEKVRITSSGSVGIGTSNPIVRFHVQADDAGSYNQISGQFIISGTTNTNKRLNIGYNTTDNAGWIQPGINGIGYSNLFLNALGGNVGIGTTSPGTTLTVEGANSAFPLTYNSGYGNIHIQTNETTATQNFGGTLTFGGLGRTSGPTEKFIWAAIAGRKEVTTSGDPRGYLQFGTTSDDTNQTKERMRITSDGYVRLASKGIQFNGDTADANSLDDYEEGTWTPVWSSAGGTLNTNTTFTTGTYTKIGNVVHIWARLYTNSVSSPTGQVTVSGLPFTVGSQVGNKAMFLFTMNAINATLTGTPTIAFNNSATTAVIYNKIWNSSEFSGDIATYFDNDTWGYFYGTYLI